LLQAVAILDVGKTRTKLSLVAEGSAIVATRSRPNSVVNQGGRNVLDTDQIENWILAALKSLAAEFAIVAIVPVAHGAAAALVSGGRLAAPVLDYESDAPPSLLAAYRALRDPFEETLSPPLPHGLNLGLQLYWEELLYPKLWPAGASVLLWPQYWAWRLCGAMASEVTSLGCHTDLWRPYENTFSSLAASRGWDVHFPLRRHAADIIGTIRSDIASATGLDAGCKVLCGLHDSNASLLASRGLRAFSGKSFAVVSTGTWFVTLQSGRDRRTRLDPARDTLANVDVDGIPTPSARFMGGREFEAIAVDAVDNECRVDDVVDLITRGVRTQPSFVPGSGPFPDSVAGISGALKGEGERAALASLHAALMTSACLDLIDAEGPILVDGRFSLKPAFLAALASLRHPSPVFRSGLGDGVALGAARLFWPDIILPAAERIEPLPVAVDAYSSDWTRHATRQI
jgi:sugar (pentulose or hexulose) kinase